ncbi:unnamed protein product, partial [Mesorhabditis spiculigera]
MPSRWAMWLRTTAEPIREFTTCRFQHSFGDAPTSHRRLFGIRRLRMLHPVYEAPQVADSPQFAAPRAQLPPVYLTAHHQAASSNTFEEPETGTMISPSRRKMWSAQFDDERIKRMEARWKKLGINPDTINFNLKSRKDAHQIRQLSAEDFTSPRSGKPQSNHIYTTASEDHGVGRGSAEARKSVPNYEPWTSHRPRINGPLLRSFDETNNEDKFEEQEIPDVVPKGEGGFGSGLGFGSGAVASPFGGGFGSKPSPLNNVQGDRDEDEEGEEDVEPDEPTSEFGFPEESATASPGGYHSRTTPVYRHFQFSQKLSQRPRLHIRKPGEPRVEGTKNNNIDDLPNLTPYMNNARHKFGYDKTEMGQQLYGSQSGVVPRTMPPPMPVVARPTTTTTTAPQVPFEGGEDTGDSGIGFGDGEVASPADGGAAFAGPSELPPEFANVGFGVIDGNGNGLNVAPPEEAPKTTPKPKPQPPRRPRQRKQPAPSADKDNEEFVIPQNSGLRPVTPPKEFFDGSGAGSFGSGSGGSPFGSFGGGGGGFGGGSGGFGIGPAAPQPAAPKAPKKPKQQPPPEPEPTPEGGDDGGMFTGDSALVPSRGPSGDGYGASVPEGENLPPRVPAVSVGGAAAGIPPPDNFEEFEQPEQPSGQYFETTHNPRPTVRPSAMLNVLSKADQGFNQAITHFERGTPVEAAAIDILEVALGSQKLDSQAKLLGHVDRTLGLDNLQRLQRWANTAGALDMLKEQVVKIAKNYQPAADLLPTIPPQFEYLFKQSGR